MLVLITYPENFTMIGQKMCKIFQFVFQGVQLKLARTIPITLQCSVRPEPGSGRSGRFFLDPVPAKY